MGAGRGLNLKDLEKTELPERGQTGSWSCLVQLGRGGTNSWDGFSRPQFSLGVDSMPCL